MTTTTVHPRVLWLPAATGTSLWVAATALLLEDAYRSGHWDVQHLAAPILTGATCIAGTMAHHALARLRIVSGLALAVLALIGSGLCVLNTLGRTAADRNHKQAVAMAGNRVLHDRQVELDRAREEMTRECKVRAQRCREWEQRVDALQRETAGMLALAVDPRADAIGRLAALVGLDAEQAKEVVKAIEPAALPIFLELGAIVLLGVAFPVRRLRPASECKREAIVDANVAKAFRALNQRELAQAWGCHESTVSRKLRALESAGRLQRVREGKSMLALPPPRLS